MVAQHRAESADMAHGPARAPGAGREGAGPRGWTGVRAGLAASWTLSSGVSRGRREPRVLYENHDRVCLDNHVGGGYCPVAGTWVVTSESPLHGERPPWGGRVG